LSQNNFTIANQTAPNFRADLNDALQALASLSSGSTEPATTHSNMLWYDTGNNILKMRTEADDAWIDIGTLDQSTNTFVVAGVPELTKTQVEDDTNTVFGQVSGERLGQAIVAQGDVANLIKYMKAVPVDKSSVRSADTWYSWTQGYPLRVMVRGSMGNETFKVRETSGATEFIVGGNGATGVNSSYFEVPPGWEYWSDRGDFNTWTEWLYVP